MQDPAEIEQIAPGQKGGLEARVRRATPQLLKLAEKEGITERFFQHIQKEHGEFDGKLRISDTFIARAKGEKIVLSEGEKRGLRKIICEERAHRRKKSMIGRGVLGAVLGLGVVGCEEYRLDQQITGINREIEDKRLEGANAMRLRMVNSHDETNLKPGNPDLETADHLPRPLSASELEIKRDELRDFQLGFGILGGIGTIGMIWAAAVTATLNKDKKTVNKVKSHIRKDMDDMLYSAIAMHSGQNANLMTR